MSRRVKKDDTRVTLEERLGSEVLKKLEGMAGEFVRFERGQFGFFIDPARYAVKQRQVGPLGRGRRRKVVAGVDKEGNIITAWIGVDPKNHGTKTNNGELVSIPDGYADGKGPGGGGGNGKGGGTGTGTGSGGGGGDGSGGGGNGNGGGGGGGSGGGGNGSGTGDGTQGSNKDVNGNSGNKEQQVKKGGAESAADVAKAAAEKRAAAASAVATSPSATTNTNSAGTPAAPDPNNPPVPKPPVGALAAKANEARGRKKKPLHWAKVPKNLLNGTFWTTLDEGGIPLDEDEIDDLFGIDIAPQFVVEQEEAKPEVLPHKRKHNINILLANLKMTADDIKDIIRVPTYKERETGSLQALLLVCPTAEEEQLLLQNQNLKDQVDKTDAFMMELATLPGLRGKILCGLSAKTFNEEAIDVIRNMDTYAMIPVEVQNSIKLSKILEIMLSIGNFLNSGTGRGGAHGFKLEALAMISTVKDSKGDSLLDYLVKLLRRNYPDMIPLDDMPTLEKSATISLDGIGEDVQSLLDSVNNVTEQIKQMGDDPTLANFKNEMVSFSSEAEKVREEIVSLRALMMDKLQSMMGHFGERNKAARGRQEDVLRMLREFSDDLRNGIARAEEKADREAKRAAKEAGKDSTATSPTETHTKAAGKQNSIEKSGDSPTSATDASRALSGDGPGDGNEL